MDKPIPSPAVADYINSRTEFEKLDLEQQLALVADITLYWAQMKTWALRQAGKTRTDSCLEAQEYYDLEKYWQNINMNVKQLAQLEAAKVRRGV